MSRLSNNQYILGGVALLAIVITIIVISLNSVSKNAEEFMEKKYSEKQLILAHHIKDNINNRLENIWHILHVVKHSQIAPFATIDSKKEEPKIAIRRLGGGLDYFEVSDMPPRKHYIRYYLTDVSGKAILTGKQINGTLRFSLPEIDADTPHFPLAEREAVNRDIGFLLIRNLNPANEKKVIDAFTPVFDNDKHSGWLVLTFDVALIYETLTNIIGKHDHNWMYDSDGTMIFCTLVPTQEYHQKEIDELLHTSANSIRISAHENNISDLLTKIPIDIGDNRLNLVIETRFDYVTSYLNRQWKFGALLLSVLFGLMYLLFYIFSRSRMIKEMADKRAELLEKVSVSEKKYRTIFEATADPVFLLSNKAVIIDLNRGAEMVFQKNRNELLGLSIQSFIPIDDPIPNRLITLKSTQGELRIDHTIKTESGNTMHFVGVYTPVQNPDGTENMILAHLHNVTELKEFEIKLSSEKKALDRMVSSIGGGMGLYDRDLTLEWCNEKYRNIFPDAETGRSFKSVGFDLVTKSLNENIQCREEREIGSGDNKRHYILSTTLVKDRLGNTINIIELLINITEQKRLQARLQHNEKLASIGELIAGIAHEINNPLAGIIGYSELLADELEDPESKDDARKILKEAKRCSKIISNLLTFSATADNDKTPLSLQEPIIAALDIIDYELSSSGIVVEKNMPKNLPEIYGNLFALQQVFLNILTNAYHFLKLNDGEMRIWISVKVDGKYIAVEIENNGKKIPEENIEKVFDPFFTSKVVGVGTGLGMSISHGIIKTHNGEISAANTERGVSFTISLPRFNEKEKS